MAMEILAEARLPVYPAVQQQDGRRWEQQVDRRRLRGDLLKRTSTYPLPPWTPQDMCSEIPYVIHDSVCVISCLDVPCINHIATPRPCESPFLQPCITDAQTLRGRRAWHSAARPKARGITSPDFPLACSLNRWKQAHDFGRFKPGAGSIKFHQPSDTFYMLYKGGDRGDGCETDPRQADLYLHCQVQDPYPTSNAQAQTSCRL